MGLIRGAANLTRYRVEGTLPADYGEVFAAAIERFAFRPLSEQTDQERSVGWVNILDMLDTGFAGQSFFKEPYLALTWRMDVRSVPASALKQQCREAENRIMAAENLEFLPRPRRLELREFVRSNLLKRALPRSRVFDMVWDLPNGVVLFGCVTTKVCDEFAEFFRRTFDLGLLPVFPYLQAARVLESDGRNPDMMGGLEPVAFHTEE